jgi:hypothetical protein
VARRSRSSMNLKYWGGRGVLGPLWITVLVLGGCESQDFKVLPPGNGQHILDDCSKVADSTVTVVGFVNDSGADGPWLDFFGGERRWLVQFKMEHVVKGHIHGQYMDVDNLRLPTSRETLLLRSLFLEDYQPRHYRVGYNLDFLGDYLGLEMMPLDGPPESRPYADRLFVPPPSTRP